jgi:hypothetical protein
VGFTAQEYSIIKELIKQAKEVNITICTDSLEPNINRETDIFAPSKRVIKKIVQAAGVDKIKEVHVKEDGYKSKELKHLEQNIYKNVIKQEDKYEKFVKDISLLLTQNPYSEVENVAKNIIKLVRDEDYSYKDIAVITKNMDEYESNVKTEYLCFADPELSFKMLDTLGRFGLPLEITEVTIPTFGEGEEFEELQAELLKMLYSVWFSHPQVDTIVYWNQVDGYCYVEDSNWNENNCRGGLFHHDLTPKKSAQMLKKLITEEWHTKELLTTNENGEVNFRGFYGEYELELDLGGETIKKTALLSSKSNNEIKVVL